MNIPPVVIPCLVGPQDFLAGKMRSKATLPEGRFHVLDHLFLTAGMT